MNETSKGRSAHRAAVRGLALVALIGVAACDESPVGVPAFSPLPCEIPDTPVLSATLDGIGRSDLRMAVLDAADRVAASLSTDGRADELRLALTRLNGNLADARSDAACRMVHLAIDALEQQPDDDGTIPDRAALRLVLEMTSATLTDAVTTHRARMLSNGE